jgi:hypothetical protein
MLGREDEAPRASPREADHDGLLRAGRIEDSECVGRLLPLAVGFSGVGAIRLPVAAPVVDDDPEVAREVGDLQLPDP